MTKFSVISFFVRKVIISQ